MISAPTEKEKMAISDDIQTCIYWIRNHVSCWNIV